MCDRLPTALAARSLRLRKLRRAGRVGRGGSGGVAGISREQSLHLSEARLQLLDAPFERCDRPLLRFEDRLLLAIAGTERGVLPLVDALLWRVQALEARLTELSTAAQQAQELARSVESLNAHNQPLQETIQTLEIGFPRHVSEQVSPDQVRLSLAGAPGACPAPAPSQAESVDAARGEQRIGRGGGSFASRWAGLPSRAR